MTKAENITKIEFCYVYLYFIFVNIVFVKMRAKLKHKTSQQGCKNHIVFPPLPAVDNFHVYLVPIVLFEKSRSSSSFFLPLFLQFILSSNIV